MRTKRPEWQVEQTRNKIRQAALELFRLQGFQEVTMRKIARRAGFSPTAIYLYYPAKDALYLEILKDGFENLLRLLQTGTDPTLSPVEKIRRYTQVYLKFSQEYPNHYDLMFSYPVPKYLDYVGTEMEHLAWEEKKVALQNLELLKDALREAQAGKILRPDLEAGDLANTLLSLCHGMISLHRSHVWAELNTGLTELYHQAVENFLSGFMNQTHMPPCCTTDECNRQATLRSEPESRGAS